LEGRIRTNNNIIYHVVDDYKTFEKHYELCKKWYLQKGATIETVYAKNAKPETIEKEIEISRKRYLPKI
jgi:hypothetical protein